MKIGILTLPIGTNIGGILQAYALQTTLCKLGHDTILIDRRRNDEKPRNIREYVRFLIHSLRRLLKKNNNRLSLENFKDTYIHKSPKLYTTNELKEYIVREKFDGIVVGSDQVWRKWYHDPDFTDIKDFFLTFLSDADVVLKISYAASFGLNEWLVDDDDKVCQEAIKTFNAISVRENSGIEICKNFFCVNAVQVLDPTLLINKEDYQFLVRNNKTQESPGNVLCYILDKTEEVKKVICKLSDQIEFRPYDYLSYWNNNIDVCQWLRAVNDAEAILTDSFHGCVFAILFNIPFVALGNELRGQARFESLLSMFDVKRRLVSLDNPELISCVIKEKINWEEVNQRLAKWRINSVEFLKKNL